MHKCEFLFYILKEESWIMNKVNLSHCEISNYNFQLNCFDSSRLGIAYSDDLPEQSTFRKTVNALFP